jgi:exoribonuclease II
MTTDKIMDAAIAMAAKVAHETVADFVARSDDWEAGARAMRSQIVRNIEALRSPAQAMSARQSQDPQGLGPQDASAVLEEDAP